MKKMLFFMVTILAFCCLFVTASASTIDDVIFTKGTTEVFVLEQGEIGATLNVSVNAAETASLITAAYENDRLTSIKYQASVSLTPETKTYTALPVAVTANTTRVDVMLWSAGLSPVDAKESLTNVSRQIKVSDVSIQSADGKFTYPAYVDNEAQRIYVEQITDWYSPNVAAINATAYQSTDTCKDYIFYDQRPAGDYPELSTSLSYKLNGEDATSTVALSVDTPQKITLTAPNGREKTYNVLLEKHVAFNVYDFDYNDDQNRGDTFIAAQGLSYYDTSIDTAVQLYKSTRVKQEELHWGGSSAYASGNQFNIVGWAQSPLDDNGVGEADGGTDTEPTRYIKLSRPTGVHGKDAADGVIKFDLNKPQFWGSVQVNDASGPNMLLRTDKYDYSFDFCYEEGATGQLIMPSIACGADDNGGNQNLMTLCLGNVESNYFDKAQLRYVSASNPASGFTGYGKTLTFLEPGQWYNIRMIVDKDNTEGAICTVVLNGEVIYKTEYTNMANAHLTPISGGARFRGMISSGAVGQFYLDNFQRTYSQAKPAA